MFVGNSACSTSSKFLQFLPVPASERTRMNTYKGQNCCCKRIRPRSKKVEPYHFCSRLSNLGCHRHRLCFRSFIPLRSRCELHWLLVALKNILSNMTRSHSTDCTSLPCNSCILTAPGPLQLPAEQRAHDVTGRARALQHPALHLPAPPSRATTAAH